MKGTFDQNKDFFTGHKSMRGFDQKLSCNDVL